MSRMSSTTTAEPDIEQGATPNVSSQANVRERVRDAARRLIAGDETVVELRRVEALDEGEVTAQIDTALNQKLLEDFTAKFAELKAAATKRQQQLYPTEWLYALAGTVILLSLFGLLAVGIAKLLGHLLALPIWPFVTVVIVILAGSIAAFIEGSERASESALAVEAIERGLTEQIRLQVVIPAVELATSIRLTPPMEDVVCITEAPGLSSRVGSDRRIQTASYRTTLTSLRRDGGATIGLSGSRGAGKSELLTSCCHKTATIEEGGPIGIVVAAPVAYEAEPFLRLLIRRLAEEVPGYHELLRPKWRKLDLAMPAAGTLIVLVGALIASGLPAVNRHSVGAAFIALGALVIAASPSVNRFISVFTVKYSRSNNEPRLAIRYAQVSIEIDTSTFLSRIWPLSLLFAEKNATARASRINRERRRQLSVTAVQVARKIQYVEQRSLSLEGSASWKGLGVKRTSSLGLAQVPLSEPDLVLELSSLVSALHAGGYEVRIGIDELDKLASTDDAEKFLTSIKNLFPIRDCSFLLTISEDAAAQFARRGMPIRDVFDSSLDTLIIVRPLSFLEARRLVRTRLLREDHGKVTDSQILACHCLAGGLPRELLRVCRQLGEINFETGGESKLHDVLETLIRRELSSHLDGIRSALRVQDKSEASVRFFEELDLVDEEIKNNQMMKSLKRFASTDTDFAAFCQALSKPNSADAASTSASADSDWIRDSRRQLYAHLHFTETVRNAFESGAPLAWSDAKRSSEIIEIFELLGEARRWLGLDTAAGWRRTANVRAKLALTRVGAQASPPAAP